MTNAFYLWMGALAVAVLSALVGLLFPPTAEEYAEYFQSLGLPPEASSGVVAETGPTGAIVTLVVTVVFVALFAFFGLKMRQGANWARITNVVLAGLGIFGGVIVLIFSAVVPVPQAGGALGVVLQVVQLLLLVGFVWFVFQRPSNEYFAAVGGR